MNNNNNRITYRFDGNGKAAVRSLAQEREQESAREQADQGRRHDYSAERVQEPAAFSLPGGTGAEGAQAVVKSKVVPLYNRLNSSAEAEITPWNSPFQDDVTALEELIRNTENHKPSSADSHMPDHSRPGRNAARMPDGKEQRVPKGGRSFRGQEGLSRAAVGRQGYTEYGDYNGYGDMQGRAGLYSSDETDVDDEEYPGNAVYARYKQAAGSPSWPKVFMTVAGALATGALFGYLLLAFFTGSPSWPGTAGEGTETGTQGVSASTGGKEAAHAQASTSAAQSEASGSVPAVAVELPEQKYYLLQYGVFGSEEGRDAALAELASKGVAGAALSSAQDYRVYAGMAADKEEASLLKSQFGDGIDLYVKTFSLSYPSQMPYAGTQETLQSFLTHTSDLVPMLLGLVNVQLEQASPSAFSDNASAAWQQAAGEWATSADAAKSGFADDASLAAFEGLTGSVQSAIQSLAGFEQNPSRAYLWQAQSALMEAVIAQKNWIEPNITL